MHKSILKNYHAWIFTFLAIITAGIILIVFPQYKKFSGIALSMGLGHLILFLSAVFTGWIIVPQKIWNKIYKRTNTPNYDFGWSPKWLYGFLVASLLTFLLAVYVFFRFENSPVLQFVLYTLLFLLAINFFAGNLTVKNSGRTSRIILPMVHLLPSGGSEILDAGCGAGRTTIALAQALPQAKIISFDKFDACYIKGGGSDLLKRNIRLAGIEGRVNIESGDITGTPFEDNRFDAIVSSYMIDHLHNGKKQALKECFRILKPGGRFLMVIIVRGYTAFKVANVLSLFLTSRQTWKKWIEETGFSMLSDGSINEGAYFFFEKPVSN